jgi:hypothetical protein
MMSEGSTTQDDLVRHANQENFQSLNLKTENNLDEYMILIVNNHKDHNLMKDLSMMISTDRVKVFNDAESTLQFIRDSHDDRNIFLIISGTLGKTCVDEFTSTAQIVRIYVYCMNEHKHEIWSKEKPKIRCTVSDPTVLLNHLHADIRQLSGRWPLAEKSFQKGSTNTSEWYHLFLLAITYRPQSMETSYSEMFDECRAYYKNNSSRLRQINDLAQTYQASNAIREYTRDSFLYRIINHALRTHNMKIIKKFSPFISDLHLQIHKYHREYYYLNRPSVRAVYRGQLMSLDELDYLRSVCKSRNPIIKLTTFGSASLDPQVALGFASSFDNRIPCLFEIIITDEYNIEQCHTDDYTQAFADISSSSVLFDEREVLFSLLTHFRIKYVSDSIVNSSEPWMSIVLELVTDKKRDSDYSHFYTIKRLKQENNPQHYADIWKKWWSNLTRYWGTDKEGEQSLLLTFYQCFTEDKHWSRKAVQMYKDVLRSNCEFQILAPYFPVLFDRKKVFRVTPAQWIALYEDYLEQFCTMNKKKVIDCLHFAGETYEMICDKDRALECYQTAIALDANDQHRMNSELKKRLKQLKKSVQPMNNDRRVATNDIDQDFQRMYQAQEEQWSAFWYLKRHDILNGSKLVYLQALREYLIKREEWYDTSDSKIILCLPYGNTPNLSIADYQSYVLPTIKRYISSTGARNNSSDYRSLTLWRYGRFMREWTLLKELVVFLRPLQENLNSTVPPILEQLEQLIKKISLLIIVCVFYLSIEPGNDKINVNKIPFLNFNYRNSNQLVFFNHHDHHLLNGLQSLSEQTRIRSESPTTTTSDPFDYLSL